MPQEESDRHGATGAPTVLVGALLLLYQRAVNEGDHAVLQGWESGLSGRIPPAGWLGAALAPRPTSQPTAPGMGTGRCRCGCTHSKRPAQRLLSLGKKQLLTAGISQFSLYNQSTNLFINYLI